VNIAGNDAALSERELALARLIRFIAPPVDTCNSRSLLMGSMTYSWPTISSILGICVCIQHTAA